MPFIPGRANGVIEQHRPIRVAFFEELEGADTVLIDLDHAGLRDLIACLRQVVATGRNTTLTDRDGVGVQPGLRVAMETGVCHQYLDGPRDDVRVLASIARG